MYNVCNKNYIASRQAQMNSTKVVFHVLVNAVQVVTVQKSTEPET